MSELTCLQLLDGHGFLDKPLRVRKTMSFVRYPYITTFLFTNLMCCWMGELRKLTQQSSVRHFKLSSIGIL